MNRLLPYVWYPALFAAALAGFGLLLAAEAPLLVASNVPILLVALMLLLLELRFPERLEWRPTRADVAADAAFMAFVQIVMPRLLAMLVVLPVADWSHRYGQSAAWPHQWPLLVQTLLMVLAVDFLRYWLHRACHSWNWLWRLHEVHHSPEVLYTLNVGRFHPAEKALHFACDTVPFLLLGVAPEVVAGYFVLYSVNGFFQHSNVRLSYGWLNYVVGSAETHRWHHAREPRTANCNFGNTTIVWDLVFGTWRLPRQAAVADIGILDRAYPRGFWAQLLAPFRVRAQAKRARLWLVDTFLPLGLRIMRALYGWRIARTSRDPMRAQQAVLRAILAANAQTTFGRRHSFSRMSSAADYTRSVPVNEFEALRPYVDAEIERGEAALTRTAPLAYLRTSGSTGQPKDIPLTTQHLAALRRIQRMSVAFQYGVCPQAFCGRILAIVSPAEEGRLANGKPFGAASGIVAAGTPAFLRERLVLPPEVLDIADPALKYLLVLRLAVAERDVTYFGSANSTTALTLMKLYREHQAQLIADLRSGGFFLGERLTDAVRRAVAARLGPNPERARELELARFAGGPRMADLWPSLAMVVTWTCGSAGVTVNSLRRELSPRTRVLELGYVASEFRGTLTLGRRAESGMPTLDTHFFEFVERDRWDRGEPEYLTLDRLAKGVEYYVIVTTPSGLYRYFINDLVRVTGFLHATPLLQFVQKGRGVTNITGEKLYESQVLAAVRNAMRALGANERFFMMVADEEARGYRLYVEADSFVLPHADVLARRVDAQLCSLNVEYAAKRNSGRLEAPLAFWLESQTGEAYKRHCVASGQREGQFKSPALDYARRSSFALDAHVKRS